MKKLSKLGIGPKMAVFLLPWLLITIVISKCNKQFAYTIQQRNILMITGIVLLVTGLLFYFSTVKTLLKGLNETKLITKGPYKICQNPLYVSLILLIIPSLSLILNSWLLLTSTLLGYILFKIFIKSEYKELEAFFGEDYLKYKSETSEFFPFLTGQGAKK
jgi:protein-S-isoprenylcysteine O-methyltransferase Ste14